jgi:DNA polymerase (family 10)
MDYHEKWIPPMKNKEIAAIFSSIADTLEIKGEIGFKVTAYRKASRILEDLTEDIEDIVKENRLLTIPGIGSGIASKIQEYIQTGDMKKYMEALSSIPETLLDLLNIQSLGAKTIHTLYKELGVKNLEDLKKVIQDGSLVRLYGLGEKKAENIKRGIEIFEKAQERISIYEAMIIANEVTAYLEKSPDIIQLSPAGSLRRLKETVGDIDLLATGKDGAKIIQFFTEFTGLKRILASGKTKASAIVAVKNIQKQLDLRVVEESSFGSALQYFTGSKAHNIKLRGLARERGLKISEYGVFRGEKKIAGTDEAGIYKTLDMPLIPPEMREDRGEIELALKNNLPQIVDSKDIKGDLHVHTHYSDGTLTVEELAKLARKIGYEYICVCDHSQSVKYANGLSPERLIQQMEEIDHINKRLKGLKILKGTEVDILQDGQLDFPEELLRKLDFVVAAIHSGFKHHVTERILKAMENPYVRVIAHPSGRLISRREGYDVDLEKVLEGAQKTGKALELNAYYDRLDLNEFYLKKAKDKGVKISIGTDTHSPQGLAMMQFGIGIARRAWLEKRDILNCLSYNQIKSKI